MGRKFNLWRCLQSTVESVYQQNVKYLDQHHQHIPAPHSVMITTDWSCSQCWWWHHTSHTGDGEEEEPRSSCSSGSVLPRHSAQTGHSVEGRGWCWPLLTEPETGELCHTTATPALCTTSPGEPWTRAVVTIRADGGNTLDTWRLFSCQCLDSVLWPLDYNWLTRTKNHFQSHKISIDLSRNEKDAYFICLPNYVMNIISSKICFLQWNPSLECTQSSGRNIAFSALSCCPKGKYI